ncbi:CobW family GTP-binding protein [Desulfomonile tiedjei]|uniref:CobW family GTP-binding protein n=1 Tax=Desulfomonile tiedjei TaxID=2358 RepID=UPI0002EF752F|nr:GTP-binding protein [Desulfomonile tiedjei]
MKITQVAGFLGCGKTTLMLRLSKELAAGIRKVALVVNEIGEIPVDGKIMEESGMRVKDIGGGCICCEVASTFAKTVYSLYKEFGPDHLLVEPTGVAVPHQVKLAARMSSRDAKISLGPAIVLFDATRPAELLDMDMLGQLVTTQVKDADVVAISKADAVSEEELAETADRVCNLNEKAEILQLSSFTGLGLERIKQIILEWKG